MNLIVDIGNSSTKLAVFKKDTLIQQFKIEDLSKDAILSHINSIDEKIVNVIVSSVKPINSELQSFFTNCFQNYLQINENVNLPYNVNYITINTLGADRMAAVAGASALFPTKNTLVIDAGTCITYDFIDENLTYHGGAISPGLNMRFKAMHNFTGQLPLLSSTDSNNVKLIGDSTENSMKSGVFNGMLFEIQGVIDQYNSQYNDLQIVLTGGDYKVFEKQLKKSIFADPNLVLLGLNKILSFNIEV